MSKPAARRAAAVARMNPGGWLWALMGVCLAMLVSVSSSRMQAQAVDEAAVLMGVAGVVAVIVCMGARARGVRQASDARDAAERPWWRPTALFAAWSLFLAWMLLSAALSARGWSAFAGEPTNLLGWFTLVAVTAVSVAAASRVTDARWVLEQVAPFVVAAQAIVVFAQVGTGSSGRGSLANSTYMGEALLIFLPWLLATNRGGIELDRRSRWILAGVAVVALATSGSRVALLVALAWLCWAAVTGSEFSKRIKLVVIAVVIVASTAGALTFARSEVLGSAGVETLGERPQLWRAVIRAVEHRPLIGYGPDGFVAGGARATTPTVARIEKVPGFARGATDPHNIFAWVAVSGGLVGLVLFLVALCALVVRWHRKWRSGSQVAAGAWSVVGALVLFATAPAALHVLACFAFVLGVSAAREDAPRASTPAGSGARSAIAWGFSAVVVVACVLFSANAATRYAFEAHSEQISPARYTSAVAASRVWSFDAYLSYLASLHAGWAAKSSPDVAVGQPDLRAIERAVELDRRDPFAALEHARTLVFYGAPGDAVESAYMEAIRRYPLYPAARAEYALLLAQQGRDAEAADEIAIASLVDDTDNDRVRALEEARRLLDDSAQ